MHGGAIRNIVMTKEAFDEKDIIDPNKTLIENGITTTDKIRVIYDYTPVSYPLLDFLPEN